MPAEAPTSSDPQRLAEELRRAVGEFVRATRAHADTLPAGRGEVLGRLDRDGPLSIALLATGRGVRHQTMSRMVGELEALGYVDRAPNPDDGRAFVIALSRAGRRALDADRRARRDWLAGAIADRLDRSERELLEQVPALLDRLSRQPEP